ncbi:ComEC/Rec2 family competence protein [Nocardia carnea]|uniref:ComEC/Rec2 family competence protein n=1 Tax=Nocardia carnea TaxID=37328 RepID=UPI0024569363|nr:ComEC/Rec2 family competence protein [Nocardia carnea]
MTGADSAGHVDRGDRPGDDFDGAARVLDARLLPAALACWAATIAAVAAGWFAGIVVAAGLTSVALVSWALLWAGVAHRKERYRVVATTIIGAAVLGAGFALAGAWREYQVIVHPLRAVPDEATVHVVITPSDDPKPVRSSGSGAGRLWVVRAGLREFRYRDEVVRAGGSVVVLAAGPGWGELRPGRPIEFRARTAPPRQHDLTVVTLRPIGPPVPAGPLPWWQDLAAGVRADLAAVARSALTPDAAGLLPALVVGDTSGLSDRVHEDFVASGLQHLCVVSGANFSVLLTAVLALARVLTCGPRLSFCATATALVFFVIIARPDPSVLRAAAMGSITLLALLTGRRKQALPALCAAVIGLLALWPSLAVQAGFALSVMATGALLLLAPSWADYLRDHGWWRLPAELAAVAAAAFVVTTPITIALSGKVSILAVLANILVAPVIAPITVLGAAAAVVSTLWYPPAELILHLTGPPLWWLLTVATETAEVPGALLTVPGGSAGGLLAACAAAAGIAALRVARLRRYLAATAAGIATAYLPLLLWLHW